jgi:hypothetical protein
MYPWIHMSLRARDPSSKQVNFDLGQTRLGCLLRSRDLEVRGEEHLVARARTHQQLERAGLDDAVAGSIHDRAVGHGQLDAHPHGLTRSDVDLADRS